MNKVQANEINLTTNEALVLQQVYEDGGAWVRLTTRGKRLVQRIWPEAQVMAA